uniref:Uncharacterized protein n=1 Tax=Anguilla anguilla TaxID=7936 RepID=A0A0E9SIH9_ANGAN
MDQLGAYVLEAIDLVSKTPTGYGPNFGNSVRLCSSCLLFKDSLTLETVRSLPFCILKVLKDTFLHCKVMCI